MSEANRVTAYLKVTAEFYDPEATPETVRACVEQDLEDAGYEVEVSDTEAKIERDFKDFVSLVTGERYIGAATYAMAKAHWLGSENYKRGNWIPVKDKPPDDHEPVFVYSLANGRMTAIYTTSGQWLGDSGYYVSDVTHWMPFPEPPEEEA